MTEMKKSYKISHEYINLIYIYILLWIIMKFGILPITPNTYYILTKIS